MSQYARYPSLSGGGGGGMTIGGTVTGGNQGSVLFIGPGSTLAQDNANFFFNDTTHALSITGPLSASNLSGTNTGDVTLGTANGLSLAGQVLSLQAADATHTGALTVTDWNTFNNKQPAGSYALTNLSNLASTAVNVDIVPAVDDSINIGSVSNIYNTGYFHIIGKGPSINLIGGTLRNSGATPLLGFSGANLDFENKVATNLADPVNPQDVATKNYVDTHASGGTENVEYHTITSGESTAKQFTLAATPTTPNKTLVDVIGGGPQAFGTDFTITTNVFSWNGLALDGILSTGDVVRLHYLS